MAWPIPEFSGFTMMQYKLNLVFILTMLFVEPSYPCWAALPFSPQQKADIIERINICEQPIFVDGYETTDFKLSIFKEQDGRLIYCGYSKKTKAKILLSVAKGITGENDYIWQARNGTILYTIRESKNVGYTLSVTNNDYRLYHADAWSVYAP